MAAGEDFIGVYDGAVDESACARICRAFDTAAHVEGRVGSGVYPELKKSRDLLIEGPAWAETAASLMSAVLRALVQYLRRYPHLLLAPLMLEHASGGKKLRLGAAELRAMSDAALLDLLHALLRPGSINLQRYTADVGGYPYWHCELYPRDMQAESLHRTLLWTIYLNDGFGDGETEFLYQERKVVPKTGRLLIAPTAFTHTHRGNRPAGKDKYIATSWILFQRAEKLFGQPSG